MSTRPFRHRARAAVTAAVLLLLSPLPLGAADPASPALVAKTNYWQGFVDFWTSRVARQDGVVIVAILVGIVSLFIITRSKAKK